MSKPKNLHEVLVEEIRDLYNAENQLIKALPKMAEEASDADLKDGFNEHLEQTREHASRLERVAELLETSPAGRTCQAMKGLIKEGSEKFSLPEGSAKDASLICAAQKVEHYEIAGYGSVRTFAETLGYKEIAKILQTTLDEEAKTDRKLTKLSESINAEAEAGVA